MARPRTISKRQLEIELDKLRILQTPKLGLEQYPVSSAVAAELLYMSGFEHRDLEGNTVDLGTGAGQLAIGAVLMGASMVVGVDIDARAIALARENASSAGVRVEWVMSDISGIRGRFDAVIMNPPYGTRFRHLDIRFLEQAFQLAPVSYSIHKSSTREYLKNFIAKKRRKIDVLRSMTLRIPHLFDFHDKKWENVGVDLYRITS